MNRDDWIFVGCKLLGLYFAVQSVLNLVFYGFQVIESYGHGYVSPNPFAGPILPIDLYRIAVIVGYFLAAYFLTHRTEWCMRMITPQRREASAPQPEED